MRPSTCRAGPAERCDSAEARRSPSRRHAIQVKGEYSGVIDYRLIVRRNIRTQSIKLEKYHCSTPARQRLGSTAEFRVADIADPLPFLESGSFDVVAASLVLHYLADWGPPLREFARILRPGGVPLISTHHPTQDALIPTPPAPYFETVLLIDTWRKGGREFQVRFYHRPISAIVDALADADFLIERIPEPFPIRVPFRTVSSTSASGAARGTCSSVRCVALARSAGSQHWPGTSACWLPPITTHRTNGFRTDEPRGRVAQPPGPTCLLPAAPSASSGRACPPRFRRSSPTRRNRLHEGPPCRGPDGSG
jgi:hypothetical protein